MIMVAFGTLMALLIFISTFYYRRKTLPAGRRTDAVS